MVEHTKIKNQCSVCETRIWEYDGVKIKKTPEYHETDVALNNGTLMTTGVCSKHTRPKGVDFAIMTEKMHQGWLEEVAFGIGNKQWVDSVGMKLEVTGVK